MSGCVIFQSLAKRANRQGWIDGKKPVPSSIERSPVKRCIQTFLYQDLENKTKKRLFEWFCCSQSTQAFDLMQRVIGPLPQQLQRIQSVVKMSTLDLAEFAVEHAEMPPKRWKVWQK